MSKPVYTYVLLDPTKPGTYAYGEYTFDHEPFYVGKGRPDRLRTHLSVRDSLRTQLQAYLSYLKGLNLTPIILTHSAVDDDDAFSYERHLISVIGRLGHGTGPLMNISDGGQGSNTSQARATQYATERRNHRLALGAFRNLGVVACLPSTAQDKLRRMIDKFYSEDSRLGVGWERMRGIIEAYVEKHFDTLVVMDHVERKKQGPAKTYAEVTAPAELTLLDVSVKCVYVLLDPTKPGTHLYGDLEFDHEPYYVGQGTLARAYYHANHLNTKGSSYAYTKKLRDAGHHPVIHILRQDLTEEQALHLESDTIRQIGRLDLKRGPLVNLADGGKGGIGKVRSQETTDKQRAALKLYFERLTEEERQELNEAVKRGLQGYWENITPEQYAKRCEGIRLYWLAKTDEERREFSDKMKQVHANYSPEQRAEISRKQSESNLVFRAAMTDEENRIRAEQISQGHARRTPEQNAELGRRYSEIQTNLDPEVDKARRAKLSRATAEYAANEDPEHREKRLRKQSASMAKAHANMTAEQKAERALKLSQAHANKSEQEQAERYAKISASRKQEYANLDPAVFAVRKFKISLTLILSNLVKHGEIDQATAEDVKEILVRRIAVFYSKPENLKVTPTDMKPDVIAFAKRRSARRRA